MIHLGDVCIGGDEEAHRAFTGKTAMCKKILIRGNHDRKSDSWYYDRNWDVVCDSISITYKSKKILFSHTPMAHDGKYDINIHGHFHNNLERLQKKEWATSTEEERNKYDLSVLSERHQLLALEFVDYRPVSLSNFLDKTHNPLMDDQLAEFLTESNLIEEVQGKGPLQDAMKAWNVTIAKDKIDIGAILDCHGELLENLNPRIAGKIRTCGVRVGRKTCPNPASVPRLLDMWFRTHAGARTAEDIKIAHIAFEDIHPFEDGNGRVGRIILNWQRVKNYLPILIIKNDEKHDKYYPWFD